MSNNRKPAVAYSRMSEPHSNGSIAEQNLILMVMTGVNAMQSRIHGMKVREARRCIAEDGGTPQAAPYGYRKILSSRHGEVTLDEDEASIVKNIFKLYGSGEYSLMSLANRLNEMGVRNRKGRQFTVATVSGVLSNPYYVGKVRHGEESFMGRHFQLISQKEFNSCQRVLHMHTRRQSTN